MEAFYYMFLELLIVKHKYNVHTKFIYDSYKNNGLNPYDTIYSYAKQVNALIYVLEELYKCKYKTHGPMKTIQCMYI